MNSLKFILLFSMINSCIELEISAPSFPAMMRYFSVSPHLIGLTISYNLLGFCIGAFLHGPLSDRFGRRRIMLLGNGLLAIGACACVIATSIHFLFAARFIQGFGAATSAVIVSAIIADCYVQKEASRLYAIMNMVFTILMACSPILGTIINTTVGWRGNYASVALIACLSWTLLYYFLPETNTNKQTHSVRELINCYQNFLTYPLFIITAMIPSLLYGCYLIFVSLAPFLYINTMHLSVAQYTVCQAIVIAMFSLGSLGVAKLVTQYGAKLIMLLAMVLLLISVCFLLFAQTAMVLTLAMSLFSIGFSFVYPIVFSRSMNILPRNKGVASSVIMSLRYLICACLTGLSAKVFSGSLTRMCIIISVTIIISLSLSYRLFCPRDILFE